MPYTVTAYKGNVLRLWFVEDEPRYTVRLRDGTDRVIEWDPDRDFTAKDFRSWVDLGTPYGCLNPEQLLILMLDDVRYRIEEQGALLQAWINRRFDRVGRA